MGKDFSMELPPGSLVFSVQGTLFRIPSALLQQHSEVLASMLHLSASEDSPIELDDPLEAFCDFRSMLLTPLNSCLNSSHPTTKDFDRLLDLLVLCHKYAAHELEEHIASLVTPLIQTDTLASNLGDDTLATTFKVLRAASVVGRPEIAAGAHNLVIRDLWKCSIHPHDTLVLAECISDNKLMGTAYYQIMVQGVSAELNPLQRQILDRGVIRCGEEWQKIFDSWGRGKSTSGEKLCKCFALYDDGADTWLFNIWSALSEAAIPWYDVVGKVEQVLLCKRGQRSICCGLNRKPIIERELARVKKEVHRYFID